ncbi:hypothetical protein L202_03175 [Cryptococcus amylolentus CBS 6039]|uniref:Uncharacterized protein n=1 Tax=Cryptococcus amylolentus CBS 6039 TaxID=1295533 RepID=A0A1E3HXM5_9TREE|nr:hypothetical protein L202_03175 [Cryptococcus amylolentus CBS 6039]ODN81080.1 hypothetical protein L202_03175 [Cryptococcus amylolentus CBS 6039]
MRPAAPTSTFPIPTPSPPSTDREEERPRSASHQTGDATDNQQNTPSVEANAPSEGSTNTAVVQAPNNRAGESSRIATPACPRHPRPARDLQASTQRPYDAGHRAVPQLLDRTQPAVQQPPSSRLVDRGQSSSTAPRPLPPYMGTTRQM